MYILVLKVSGEVAQRMGRLPPPPLNSNFQQAVGMQLANTSIILFKDLS